MKMVPINIFDFDGTLTDETWPKFWAWVRKFRYTGGSRNAELEKAIDEYKKRHPGPDLENFFGFFHQLLVDNIATITMAELMEGEQFIHYNPGITEYFESSDDKNYIVSGGLVEFLENLETAKYFCGIYGTPLKFDDNGEITGIEMEKLMTDNKKISAIQDILQKNGRQGDDCHDVYYIGDGYTDYEAMQFVHSHGGKAIFVHQPNKDDALSHHNRQIYEALNKEGVLDCCCIADCRKDSLLSKVLNRQQSLDKPLEVEF